MRALIEPLLCSAWRRWKQLLRHGESAGPPQLTFRAVAVGLLCGTILCFTNMYFGLQTGWVTMGSLQSALLGYGIFQACGCCTRQGRHFGPLENVVVQTVSVATATLPLAGGFVGIIPALSLLSPSVTLTPTQQLLWAAALTYFGIFFAVPLRRQTILVEKLPFPSGTATGKLIDLLHSRSSSVAPVAGGEYGATLSGGAGSAPWRALAMSFGVSFGVSAFAYAALPAADPSLHVGTWVGLPHLTTWKWTLRLSLGLVGQGMIMGTKSALSLLLGAVLAWGYLGPRARSHGWANGPIFDFEHGAQGWVLWVSIGLMVAESLSSFAVSVCEQSFNSLKQSAKERDSDDVEIAPPSQLVPTSMWLAGLGAAAALSAAVLSPMFDLPVWQILVGVALSCLVALLAVRALGQTDLNPVSGVGKLSQIVFALVAPGHLVANLVAGALAEAGAQQAGDLLQDLKAGHLLQASPRAQFYGQLIGSTASILITVGVYQLYDTSYHIPSEQFPAPVANVWKGMAELMNKGLGALPPTAVTYARGFMALGVALPVVDAIGHGTWISAVLPSGTSMGVGMYLTADFVIPRVLGALGVLLWRKLDRASHDAGMLAVASGFVLGEGVWSIFALGLKILGD